MPVRRYERPTIFDDLVAELGDPLATPVPVSELPVFLCVHDELLTEPCVECAAGSREPSVDVTS